MSDSPRSTTSSIFFGATALLHAAAIVSRFDEIEVPLLVEACLVLAHVPLLLVEAVFVGRLVTESAVKLPLWMRIPSKPARISITLAFTFLSIVLFQHWDVSLGPIDPSPPEEWATEQRAMFFAIMSFGMFFPNYLAASGLVLPAMRAITKPFERLPIFVTVVGVAILGTALGVALVALLASETVGSEIYAVQDTIWSSPALALTVTLAFVLVPAIIGMVTSRFDREEA